MKVTGIRTYKFSVPTGQQIRAVAGGQLIWWLETAGKGTRVAFCGLAGREIECQSKVLAEAD